MEPCFAAEVNKVCLTGGDDDDDGNPWFVVNSFRPEQGEIMGDRHSCWRVQGSMRSQLVYKFPDGHNLGLKIPNLDIFAP